MTHHNYPQRYYDITGEPRRHELLESDAWVGASHTDPARFRAFVARFIEQVDVYDATRVEAVWLTALETVVAR